MVPIEENLDMGLARGVNALLLTAMVVGMTACAGVDDSPSPEPSVQQPAQSAEPQDQDAASVPEAVVVSDGTPAGEASDGMLLFGITLGGSDYSRSCRIVGLKEGQAVIVGDYDPAIIGPTRTVLTCDNMRQFAPDGSYGVTTNSDEKTVVIFADGTTNVISEGDGAHTLPAVNPVDGRVWYWVRYGNFSYELRSIAPDGTGGRIERGEEAVTVDTEATRSEHNLVPGDQFMFIDGEVVRSGLTHDERYRATLVAADGTAVYKDENGELLVGSPDSVQTNPVYAASGVTNDFTILAMLDANTVVGTIEDKVVLGRINHGSKIIDTTWLTENLRDKLRLFPDYDSQLADAKAVVADNGEVLLALKTNPYEHDGKYQTHLLQVGADGQVTFVANLQFGDGDAVAPNLLGVVVSSR